MKTDLEDPPELICKKATSLGMDLPELELEVDSTEEDAGFSEDFGIPDK